jgi:hypothetical protein
MGFFSFLDKKPSVNTTTNAPPMGTGAPTGTPYLDLPELPSVDTSFSGMGGMDLPPLPSFSSSSGMNVSPNVTEPPKDFVRPNVPQMNMEQAPPAFPDIEEPQQVEETHEETKEEEQFPAPTENLPSQYEPVFCDVETYRVILANLTYAKEEVLQLQTFAESGKHLQIKTQAKYEAFQDSVSVMAKKMLMAEALMFRQ